MKKLIIVSLVVGGFYLTRKFNITTNILSQLKTKIQDVTSVNIANGFINLKIDLNITNLSKHKLYIDTFNTVAIRKLRFFNAVNRKLVGEAKVNITNIELQSKESIILADIICNIPTGNILHNLTLINTNLSDTLRVVPVFTVGGKEVEINPEKFV